METLEQEIQRKGLTAPRVTPDDIEANIASAHYFTAEHGVAGASGHEQMRAAGIGLAEVEAGAKVVPQLVDCPLPLSLLTICVLVLRNGFTVIGTSACASPENFDAELGRKIARADAVRQMWPLMGYQLRSVEGARKRVTDEVNAAFDRAALARGGVVDDGPAGMFDAAPGAEPFAAIELTIDEHLALGHSYRAEFDDWLAPPNGKPGDTVNVKVPPK